jgi:hypothetical protein
LFLTKINKVDKPLAKLNKRKRQKTQIDELCKFLNAYDLSKLKQENISHLNISITINEFEY